MKHRHFLKVKLEKDIAHKRNLENILAARNNVLDHTFLSKKKKMKLVVKESYA